MEARSAAPKPAFGTTVPWFRAQVLGDNSAFTFDTVAGRPVVLFFMGSAGNPGIKNALDGMLGFARFFDDAHCCFFGISTDPEDVAAGRIKNRVPGIRYFLDFDRAISLAYGACGSGSDRYEPFVLVLDRQLRVAGAYPPESYSDALLVAKQLVQDPAAQLWAPVLQVPRIFEPELCRHLIELYEEQGGVESGFMREIDGKTVVAHDYSHKRRSDVTISNESLRRALADRINQRLRPMIKRIFNFDATRMERYLVACYDSAVAGHFRPHRDNTTKGTAHRRFAVTINLNGDFIGGDLCFPEYGPRTYRAPTGGAIVFSCGLLHEAKPVTEGRRYAFLPFLYDEAAAALREKNNVHLGEAVAPYRQS